MRVKLLIAGAALASLLTGCPPQAPDAAAVEAPLNPDPAAQTAADAPADPAAEQPAAEQPATFSYTDQPTAEMIPAGPIRGEANGQPFEVKQVVIEPGLGGWNMYLLETELSDPTGIREGQYLNLELGAKPASGKTVEHPMAYGDGLFQINDPSEAGKTTSLNADNAWVIVFDNVEIAPYDKEGEMFQVAGKASGKLAVCYQGRDEWKNSYVAGEFKDAIVRYMGEPTAESAPE